METMISEHKLLEGVINRDEDSFRIFVERYQDFVFNISYQFLKDKNDADDIAQEVFIKVYESAHTFRKESKISTWLYRITVNKSLNFIRSRKRFSLIERLDNLLNEDGEFNSAVISPQVDEHTESQKSILLHSALNTLPEKQRTAFTLSKIENLSYKEIADIMETSLSSVESLIHRAKIGLQKKLYKKFKKLN
ncbi:RNA polymerase sigma factor [Bacteroidota bacterium]